ncbi:ComEC/Rec2 family competence protein [Micrococcus lylae]|uniref:ComEC/Rec2 family competence protein n=1 Tax=Micrococcus lylae TaxID=1273 RepID=UPI0021A3D859|nr:ComEC/Rec2 family competence protein [Micrococcus lylae]MCT2006513.1 ComEC/Rec2 family competence protein [Micrococcus lylae]MCT2071139.1 ComEC/Rec2 family competence protein [Micrococcus lylae]
MNRRLPAAIDARWAPALVTALAVGNLAPQWTSTGTTLVSVGLVAVAIAAAVTAVGLRGRARTAVPPATPQKRGAAATARERGAAAAARTAAGALAVAAAVGALVSQSVALRVGEEERIGWAQTLQAEQPVRVALQISAEPRELASAYGARRAAVTVDVTAFGPDQQGMAETASAVLTGPEGWLESAPGESVCAVVEPRREDGTVFLRATADPRPAPCVREDPDGERPGSRPAAHGGDGVVSPDAGGGRERLRAAFRDQADGTLGAAGELIPGLVLGDRSAQSPETDQAMKDAGLSHLSAVSGANCALLAGAVTGLLRLLRVNRTAVFAAVIATLVVFVVIVGPEPSVLRAAVMGGLGALALFGGRSRHAFTLLCLAGTAVVVAVPGLATEPALQLSVAATAGIILGARPAEAHLYRFFGHVLPGWAARWLSVTLAVTTCAHLACQPILLAMTGTVSAYAIPANMLAAPAVAPITVLGTAAAGLVLALPPVSAAIVWVIQLPAAYIGLVAHVCAGLPGALRPWPEGGLGLVLAVLTVAATAALYAVLLLTERRRHAPVRRQGLSAPRRGGRLTVSGVLVAVLIASGAGGYSAVVLPAPAGQAPADWAVAFCDVGQGDMAVLRSGPERAVVVDVGPEPEPAAACLEALGIARVDAVLLTHLHADHTGGLDAAIALGAPALRHATRGEGVRGLGLPAAAGEEAGTDPPPGSRRLRTGDRESSGDVTWQVLLADEDAATENDASAQILATVQTGRGPLRVFFTGDIEQDAADAWIAGRHEDAAAPPAHAHLYSVAHHGARNGGAALPRAVDADAYVVSAGRDNPYGHPHPQTLQVLAPLGAVLRTDEAGTVVVSLEAGTAQDLEHPADDGTRPAGAQSTARLRFHALSTGPEGGGR